MPFSGEQNNNATQVTQHGGFSPAIESLDGQHLYYSKKRTYQQKPEHAIWRISLKDGHEEPVIESLVSSATTWDLTPEGILFVDFEQGERDWLVKLLRKRGAYWAKGVDMSG